MRAPLAIAVLLTGCACHVPDLQMAGPAPLRSPPTIIVEQPPELHVSKADLAPCDTRLSWIPKHGPISQSTWQLARAHDKDTIHACADNAEHKADLIRALLGKIREQRHD